MVVKYPKRNELFFNGNPANLQIAGNLLSRFIPLGSISENAFLCVVSRGKFYGIDFCV